MFKAMGLEDADTGMDQSLIPSAEKSFDDTESWGGSSIKPLDRTKRWHRIHVTVLYLIVVALLGTIAYLGYGPSTPAGQKLLVLSPAQSAVEYVVKMGMDNFDARGTYMGTVEDGVPSNESDELWDDLTRYGVSSITASEAKSLPNRTFEIPGEPGHFIVQLEVFHQLHCLNSIRKTLFPERYGDNGEFNDYLLPNGSRNYTSLSAKHYDHCIDAIRESLQCHGDVSAGTWEWNEARGRPLPAARIPHLCKDFSKIHEWSEKHALSMDYSEIVREWISAKDELRLSA